MCWSRTVTSRTCSAVRRRGRPACRSSACRVAGPGENWKVRCYEALDRFHLRFMDRVVCVFGWTSNSGPERRGAARPRPRHSQRDANSHPRVPIWRDTTGCAGLRAVTGRLFSRRGDSSPEKGFAVLVDAARMVRQAEPAVRFVLFGEGPERPLIERRISELGLMDTFHLPGFRDDLDVLIPWAQIVALPSFTEGLPNVALEASAAGVPVVATAVGGTGEVVVNGQTGFLVPAGDATRLADRIIDLVRNPDWGQALGPRADVGFRSNSPSRARHAPTRSCSRNCFHAVAGVQLRREALCA